MSVVNCSDEHRYLHPPFCQATTAWIVAQYHVARAEASISTLPTCFEQSKETCSKTAHFRSVPDLKILPSF